MARAQRVPFGPKKVEKKASPLKCPELWIVPPQNHFVPPHINNRYINSYKDPRETVHLILLLRIFLTRHKRPLPHLFLITSLSGWGGGDAHGRGVVLFYVFDVTPLFFEGVTSKKMNFITMVTSNSI